MPLYDYECPDCGTVREVQHSVSEIGKIQVLCGKCGSPMKKMISLPALIGFDEVGRSGNRKDREESKTKDSSSTSDASKAKDASSEAAKGSAPGKESGKASTA